MKSFLKKVLIFAAVMAVVAAAGWFGRKAYKRSAEHKLIALARQYEAQKDWHNTNLCLERVLQINPVSAEAYKMIADLLESTGSPSALIWRVRLAENEPDNVTNRLLWAQTAIKFQNLKSAEEALSKIDDQTKKTAAYHKMAGALAWNLGQPAEAENQYAEALRLEPDNQAVLLNLESIRLTSTNQTVAAPARLALESTITNAALRPVALQHLLTDALDRHNIPKAVAYSTEIVRQPTATFSDKINHLQLLHVAKSDDYGPWLASLQAAALHSPADAFALGRSLATTENPGTALRWLHELPLETQTNLPVPLIITDCQIALKDWNGLLTFVNRQDWGEIEFYRLAVESLAQRSLNHDDASQTDWHKTLRLTAHHLDRLTRLADVTRTWGWAPEQTEVLLQITDEFPDEKWAVSQLMAQYYADGKTGELQRLLLKSHTANPDDTRIENNLANILLLRKSELDQANLMAKQVYEASPSDPFFISTYAYSLFLQKKPDEALKVLNNLKPEYLKIPSIAAYYGVIQAGSGHQALAREPIALADSAKLLPEEKEMVRLAKARL